MPTSDQLPIIVSSKVPLNGPGLELANLAAWHLLRIGQSGILAAPPPGSAQPLGTPSNPATVSNAPWLSEPPGSVSFDERGNLNLPLGTKNADTTVLTFAVPQGFDGVIKWISNNAVNAQPAFLPGDFTWKININGRIVRNFGNILLEMGSIQQGRQESPIRIFSGDIVTYTVAQNSSGPAAGLTTGMIACSLTGYLYPSRGVS